MPSTPQTVPAIQVFDYAMQSGDPAATSLPTVPAGTKVTVTLQYKLGRSAAPVTWVAGRTVYATITDSNGYWTVFVMPNNKISPANTFYTVEVEGFFSYKIQVTDVGVPVGGWQSSAVGILLDVPAALAPTTSTVGAITATGLITAQAGINITAGGLTVAGGETTTGSLTVDTLFYSTAVSRLIPGATSFSVRDNANANDNLLVSNAGNVTVRGSLTITTGPLNVSAGGITVTAGGAAITGNSTITGTLTITQALTVNAGGASITGNSTVTGTLTVSSTFTVSGGGAAITGNTTITGNVVVTGTLTIQTALNSLIIGTGVNALTLNDQQTTAQTLNFPNIREAETVAVQPQITSTSPANPATTVSTVFVMAGLARAITPQVTGRVLIIIEGDISNNTASDGADVQIQTGTGGAPANGAALTGTTQGGFQRLGNNANTGGAQFPFSLAWIATGLVAGTAIWIDLAYRAVTGGTVTLSAINVVALEL